MPHKLKSNQLAHIDNSFYFLTAKQAKALSVENRLPRPGYAIRANLDKLRTFTLGKIERYETAGNPDNCRFRPFDNQNIVTGWIQQTPLSWWNGEPTSGQVWAVQIR